MILSPDTNLLVYAHDDRDPAKRQVALAIVDAMNGSGTSLVALQVIGELYAVLTRRLRQPRDLARAAVLATMDMFETFGYEAADVHDALASSERGVFSYWDGLLIASAARTGCTHLVSEDMQDGFRHGPLEIVSPFAGDALNPRLGELLDSLAPRLPS